MSSFPTIVFPTPPPTRNDLSSHQRIQLLRKAKKLEQIFGATPRLFDENFEPSDPIHVAYPRRQPRVNLRGSIDSSSSTSSCESVSPSNPLASYDHLRASSASPVSSVSSCETFPGRTIRLLMKAPARGTVAASPSQNNTSHPYSARQSPVDRDLDMLFTQLAVIPDEDSSLRNSTTTNSYNITSLSTLRKQKMDRLRRKLGQDVPHDLVFPSSDTESERSITPGIEKSGDSISPLARRPRKKRISSTRDSISISGSTLVHHAKRQSDTSQTVTTPTKAGSLTLEPDQIPKSEPSTRFNSTWSVNTGATEVKLWSARRGYERLNLKAPSNALQTPSNMTSSHPPPPLSGMLSNTGLDRKPSSYRKPVRY